MTVFLAAGDVGYVPQTFGHDVGNTDDTDLIFIEMFKIPNTRIFPSRSGSPTRRRNW